MQTRMIGCVFVHLLTGFLFLQCESITLTSKGSIDGSWTFREGDHVTLTCNIPSYTGEMTWKFDSADAAKCTPQVCNQIISGGDGLYIFGFDTSSYNFTWTFTPIKSLHDGKVFACFDGANTEMFTAVVKSRDTTDKPVIPIEEIDETALAAAILAVAGLVLLAIVLVVLCIETIRKKCNCCSREACSLLFFQTEHNSITPPVQTVKVPEHHKEISAKEWNDMVVRVRKLEEWKNSLLEKDTTVQPATVPKHKKEKSTDKLGDRMVQLEDWQNKVKKFPSWYAVDYYNKEISDRLRQRVVRGMNHPGEWKDEDKDTIDERNKILLSISDDTNVDMWWISYYAMCMANMTLELQKLHYDMAKLGNQISSISERQGSASLYKKVQPT